MYSRATRGLRTGLTALLSAVAVFVVPAAAQAAKVFIRHVLTHKEYDRGKWKNA